MYSIIGYPSDPYPGEVADFDGYPDRETAYIVDGDLVLYDENGTPFSEAAEQEPGPSLDVGRLYQMDVQIPSVPFSEFNLLFTSPVAIWRDRDRTDSVQLNCAVGVGTTTFYVEILGATIDAEISLFEPLYGSRLIGQDHRLGDRFGYRQR